MKTLYIIVTIAILSFGCKTKNLSNLKDEPLVLYNQVGYLPSDSISLVALDEATSAWLTNISMDTFHLNIHPAKFWEYANQSYTLLQYPDTLQQGRYDIWINGNNTASIRIDKNAYAPLAKAALKAFYLTRASMDIEEKYAGKFHRTAGHPDTLIYVHASAADTHRPEGTIISSPGGWYDAGDYNKYIVNSAITVYTLLSFYEAFPQYCTRQLNVDIPKTDTTLPDILEEAWYNINWMLTMQAPDGGVYHKLTTLTFEDFVQPVEAKKQRFVVQKSTPATLDFAAVMAKAARIYKQFDITKHQQLHHAAQAAMKWAQNHPDSYYNQPPDVKTGAYPDTTLTDEWLWAQTELALLNGNTNSLSPDSFKVLPYTTPSWDVVTTLAGLTILQHQDSFPQEIVSLSNQKMDILLSKLYAKYHQSAMLTSLDYFKWGSNSDALNQAVLGIFGFKYLNNHNYLRLAKENSNYLLGRNATGYCFITGFGELSPIHIHHRISGSDSVVEPLPGLVVGGPNLVVPDDMGNERSPFPGMSYIDNIDSYSTNEVAINWNAPAVFVFGALDAITNKH